MKTKKIETDNSPGGVADIQKRVCSWALAYTIIIALVFILFDEKAIAKGLIFGALFSIVNFVLLGKSVPMALGKSRSKAGMIGLFSILGRYALLAIPMIVAVKSDAFNFFAVVVGIFSVQIVMFIDYVLIKPRMEREKK